MDRNEVQWETHQKKSQNKASLRKLAQQLLYVIVLYYCILLLLLYCCYLYIVRRFLLLSRNSSSDQQSGHKFNPSAYLRRQHRELEAGNEVQWETHIWNNSSKVRCISRTELFCGIGVHSMLHIFPFLLPLAFNPGKEIMFIYIVIIVYYCMLCYCIVLLYIIIVYYYCCIVVIYILFGDFYSYFTLLVTSPLVGL